MYLDIMQESHTDPKRVAKMDDNSWRLVTTRKQPNKQAKCIIPRSRGTKRWNLSKCVRSILNVLFCAWKACLVNLELP